jgi:hypothetical protein
MINDVMKMQQIMYHIHGLSELLSSHHFEAMQRDDISQATDQNRISEPLLTIADLIREKAELCLEKLELFEVYFHEADKEV